MIKKYFFCLFLFVGLLGALLSMLAWNVGVFGALFTGPVSLAGIQDGFFLLFNRLFEISEARQAFVYVMFEITSAEADWAGYTANAAALAAAMLLVVSVLLAATRSKVGVIILLFAVAGVQVYFGVFAGAAWNILLFAAFAVMLVENLTVNLRVLALAAGVLAVVTLGVWWIFPGENAQLHAFSEAVRDRWDTPLPPYALAHVGTHDAAVQPEYDPRDFAVVAVQDDALHDAPVQDFYIEYDDQAQGAEIGFAGLAPSLLPAVIFVLAVALVAAVVRFVPPLWRARRRRRGFVQDDCPAAINNMFIYLLEWLGVLGLEQQNKLFSAHTPRLAALISPQYADEYKKMTHLWQKTVYSSQAAGEDERTHMQAFVNKTATHVWRNVNFATKMRIKFHHYL